MFLLMKNVSSAECFLEDLASKTVLEKRFSFSQPLIVIVLVKTYKGYAVELHLPKET